MRGDQVLSLKADPQLAASVDAFARDYGLTRSAALMLLVAYGLNASKGEVFRSALRMRQEEQRR